MKKFTAKFIKRGANAFSLSVNFTVFTGQELEITTYALDALRNNANISNIDDYKLLSITEK